MAVLRVSGKEALKIAKTITKFKKIKARIANFSTFYDSKNRIIDKGIFIFFPKPNSYTGDDVVEFHVHGSNAVVKYFLEVLSKFKNCRLAKPGEFTKTALFNKKTIESLIKAGAFDSLGHSRKGLMSIYLEAIDSVMEEKRAQAIGQFDLFGGANEVSANGISTLALEVSDQEWDKALLLSYEREMLGLYVSDHPLLGVEHVLRSATDTTISQILDEGVVHDQIITIAGLITAAHGCPLLKTDTRQAFLFGEMEED